jgi:hypothetical protein
MLLAPRWQRTRDLVRSALTYVPLALAYTALLVASWQPDTLSLILPGSLQEGLAGADGRVGGPRLLRLALALAAAVDAAPAVCSLLPPKK